MTQILYSFHQKHIKSIFVSIFNLCIVYTEPIIQPLISNQKPTISPWAYFRVGLFSEVFLFIEFLGLFSGGLIFGWAYYREITVFCIKNYLAPSPSSQKALNPQNDVGVNDLEPRKRTKSISIVDKNLGGFEVEKALKIIAKSGKNCGTRTVDH